jgi:predicted nucleic acid-binding Zn ribbon protein
MTPEERTAFEKRRRQRNWAMLFALIGLVVLFYFISVARLLRG